MASHKKITESDIVRMYYKGMEVKEIYKAIKIPKLTLKTIAKVIVKRESYGVLKNELYIIVPSIMNYKFKLT